MKECNQLSLLITFIYVTLIYRHINLCEKPGTTYQLYCVQSQKGAQINAIISNIEKSIL